MSGDEVEGDASPAVNAIGISFGNSNSSIAYATNDGKAEVIANEEGDRYIPSVLSYIEGEEYHGTQAKTQLVRNSKNTVAYFRDYIGRDFSEIDPSPCQASAHPHKHDSTVAFSVRDTGSDEEHTVSVSEIATRHIKRLAASASEYLGRSINAAVITVPTDWKDTHKEALVKAAANAGVQVLQLIAEPTAAVLAYDARPEAEHKDKIIAVADFGGTRSDVSVIASRGGMYSILATKHGYEIAGAQLDAVLVEHFAKEFLKKNKSAQDPRKNARGLAKLQLEAEATKKALSLGGNASLSVESLSDGLDFSATINRTRYELLAGKIFSSMVGLVREAVQLADLDVLDIDEVVLSGGTSHTPRLAHNVSALFPSSVPVLAPATSTKALDPSSLAARGAAMQASLVADFEPEDIAQSTHPMVTVTPHLANTIGLLTISEDVTRGVFRPLLAQDTPLPARRSARLPAPKAGGSVLVKIVEAERRIKETRKERASAKKSADEPANKDDDDDDEDDDDDSEEEEDEVIREKTWTIRPGFLAEAAVRDIPPAPTPTTNSKESKKEKKKKGEKEKEKEAIEVTLDVAADMGLKVSARYTGGTGGVRGTVKASEGTQNGSA